MQAGSTTRFDLNKPAEKAEFCYLTSSSSPYINYISVQLGASMLDDVAGCFSSVPTPTDPSVPDTSNPGTGSGDSSTVIPVLNGDVQSNGYNNTVTIAPGAIRDLHVAVDAKIDVRKLDKNPLDRSLHFGTQTAETISDLEEFVKSIPLNQLDNLTSDLNLKNRRIIELADPIFDQDAVTKKYAEALLSNINLDDVNPPMDAYNFNNQLLTNLSDPINDRDATNKLYVDNKSSERIVKTEADLVSTLHIENLSGTGEIVDGQTVQVNDIILLTGQSNARMNGLWLVQNGNWCRVKDASRTEHFKSGMIVFVSRGINWKNTGWKLNNPSTIVLGVSSLYFSIFTGLSGVNISNGIQYDVTTNLLSADVDNSTIVLGNNGISLAPNYRGQNTITVLGNVTSGAWLGNTISIAHGGTGATTPSEARSNINAASCGVNNDITALNGLVEPILITQGGTGATSIQAARANLQAAEVINGVNSSITHLPNFIGPWALSQGGTGATTAANARLNLAAAKAGDNFDIISLNSLTTAISISQGGTGANTADLARANLEAAASGINSDITQLTALATPLSLIQGGTGATNAFNALLNLEGIGQIISLGTGESMYVDKSGVAARFKSIRALPGVSVQTVGDELVISPNLQAGTGIDIQTVGNSLVISVV